MPIYFEDEYDFDGQWLHTVIHVPEVTKPYYQVFTGGEYQRFMLTGKDYSYYWGAISADYYEVSLLYNPSKANQFSPILPINSPDIEQFKQQSHVDYWQYWANFFAKQLQTTPYSFLYAGDWWLFPLPMESRTWHFNNYFRYDKDLGDKKQPKFTLNAPKRPPKPLETAYIHGNYQHSFAYHISQDLVGETELLHELRWDDEVDTLIYQPSHLPDADDGRVKWWRKKLLENSCPPLLVWYQSHLQGYFLIDGYARLKAYLLEHIVPDIMVITPIQQITYGSDLDRHSHILQSLKNNMEHSPTPLPMDKINNALIQAFDDNTRHSSKGKAKPIRELDELWLTEVKKFIGDERLDQQFLEFLINDKPSYLVKKA